MTVKKPIDPEDMFLGTLTVGERGQVVIPAKVRKLGNIHPGDKLFILKSPIVKAVTICKLESAKELLTSFLNDLDKWEKAEQNLSDLSDEEED